MQVDPEKTVLGFLEKTTATNLPRVTTVARSTTSKFQFYLVVRHYRKRLRRKPLFFQYAKAELPGVKALLEEHSLFSDAMLVVLEGFAQTFVDQLQVPEDTYIVAETDGTELVAEEYSYRQKRNILKVLTANLNIRLSLRELVALDWSSMR